ncbi:MAG: heme exporter protein CcmD [Pseudomonadota bacterium]
MYFDSIQALLHMDGHGPYVWACYGMGALVFLGLVLSARAQSKRSIEMICASDVNDEDVQ